MENGNFTLSERRKVKVRLKKWTVILSAPDCLPTGVNFSIILSCNSFLARLTDIESLQRYSDGIFISTQVASFISNLGYSATANFVSHYEAILPPLAVDAGLGEVGRIGYLITKKFGPRVRLAAVSTELPLRADKPVDIGVQDFCRICEKCATCCPSRSIPFGDPGVVNGSLRWKLNAETCFELWGKAGSGCTICMRVCPWSHERTFPHKVITELVIRNRNARRLFTVMDDIFYGKRPATKPAPSWARFEL